jgi:hypothetical protein
LLWCVLVVTAGWQSLSTPAWLVWLVGLLGWGYLVRRLARHGEPPREPFEAAMRETCARYGAGFLATPPGSLVRVSGDVAGGQRPLAGRRSAAPAGSGWHIWAGDEPLADGGDSGGMHAALLCHRCPDVAPMLGLPDGWSFRLTLDGDEVRDDTGRVVPLPTTSTTPSRVAESESN